MQNVQGLSGALFQFLLISLGMLRGDKGQIPAKGFNLSEMLQNLTQVHSRGLRNAQTDLLVKDKLQWSEILSVSWYQDLEPSK